jgi:hypothetical protein
MLCSARGDTWHQWTYAIGLMRSDLCIQQLLNCDRTMLSHVASCGIHAPPCGAHDACCAVREVTPGTSGRPMWCDVESWAIMWSP